VGACRVAAEVEIDTRRAFRQEEPDRISAGAVDPTRMVVGALCLDISSQSGFLCVISKRMSPLMADRG